MTEQENPWPSPERVGGAAAEPWQAPTPGPTEHGLEVVDDVSHRVGAEQVAADALLWPAQEPVAEPVVASRAAARVPAPRRSLLRPAVIWPAVAALVVVVAVAAFLLLRDNLGAPEASPAPTVTRTLPAPTATTDPVDRGEGSALFVALPGTVRQYVLIAISPADTAVSADPAVPAVDGGALEAYSLTYAGALPDAGDPADVEYTVQVSQWATAEEATAAAAALAAPLAPASSTGQVQAVGVSVGAFSLFGEDGPGTADAVWTNGTVVLHASGPAADIRNFYLAFSL